MGLFLVKKMISALLSPYSLALELLTVGAVLFFCGWKMKTARVLVVSGLALLVAQSIPLFPNLFGGNVKRAYPPLVQDADIPRDVRWVVVLSGATIDDPAMPISSRNVGDTLHRVVEGVVLAWKIPEAKLLLAGGALADTSSLDTVMAQLARELHFPAERIVTETQGRDTEEQVRHIAERVGDERFLLVTALRHMPRSMLLFQGYGMHPVPAPAANPASAQDTLAEQLFPTPGAAVFSASIAHEVMGEAWFKLKRMFL